MGLKIKVPVSEVRSKGTCEIVEETLRSDPKNAYTIMGLMVEKFNVREQDVLGKSFSNWKPGLPSMYTRIRTCLEKMHKEGKVNKRKHEKAFVYWWAGETEKVRFKLKGDYDN